MVITDYHVQSVLRTYSRQLQRSKLVSQTSEHDRPLARVTVSISDEARQRLLLDRIKSQALEQAYQEQDDVLTQQ
jgi:hypothetical protein